MTVTAAWLWRTPAQPAEAVDFAVSKRLREVFVHVRLSGVDEATAALVGGLRGNGIAVSALGGDPQWTYQHEQALDWAVRATDDLVFDGVHLDVEPWTRPDWPDAGAELMEAYATLVEEMTEIAPTAVDVPPWLAESHPGSAERAVRACRSVTVLAYRDRAAEIMAMSAPMLQICHDAGTRYRLGVETGQPSAVVPPGATFGDDGEAVMCREIEACTERLGDQPLFTGFAVHHLLAWSAMRP